MNKNIFIMPLITFITFVALILVMGAFIFPPAAFAQTQEDTTPPTVTASLSGEMLDIQAKDDLSGVAAVYIDGHLVSALTSGGASVRLRDYAGDGGEVVIYATDAAGNRSDSVTVPNPYYQGPSDAADSFDTAVASSPSSIDAAQPESDSDEAAAEGDAAVSGENAFTLDGNGTVQDNATDQDGKEFFAITTEDGTVYYLVIDRQRGTENVYFLSPVSLDDLTGLAQAGDGSVQATPEAVTQGAAMQAAPTPSGISEAEAEGPAQSGGSPGTLIFILIAMAVAGGAGYYFKIVKPRKRTSEDEEYIDEYEDGDEPDPLGGQFGDEAPDEAYFFEEEGYGQDEEAQNAPE
jgi:hypothetical protein